MSAAADHSATARAWSTARAARDLFVIKQSDSIYLVPPAGKPVRLNFAASFLWQRLSGSDPFSRIISDYENRFGPGAADAISGFLLGMSRSGLVVFSDDASLGDWQ